MLLENYYPQARPQPDHKAYAAALRILDEGGAVAIQGSSGSGKTETISAIRNTCHEKGRPAVYLDMRHVRGDFDLYQQIGQQLGIEQPQNGEVSTKLGEGGIVLLLDEAWAGLALLTKFVPEMQANGNQVITVAGIPPGVEYTEIQL